MSYDGTLRDRYVLSAGDVMGVQRRYGRKPADTIVGYGGHCVKVNLEGDRLTSAACSTAAGLRWSYVALDGTRLEALRNSGGSGLQWERTSNNASASIRGQDPGTSALQRFTPTSMLWKGIGNMCVTVANASAGELLRIQECEGASHARWDFFAPFSDQIRLSGTNLCVRAENTSASVGDDLYLATCSAVQTTQSFTFDNSVIRYDDTCFNVRGGSPNAGAQVFLWDGCSAGHQNTMFHISGRLKNGSACVRWANGPSQAIGEDLLVGECYAEPVPDAEGYARPDSMSWDIYF
jgi:hypothetical protein